MSNNLDLAIDFISATIRLTVPLAYAANGGLYSERAGILNIALEGMLLTGAFASAAVAFLSGNPWLALLAAIFAGAGVGLLHAFLSINLRVNQVVSGLAINLVAAGVTAFFARLLFIDGATQSLATISPLEIPGLVNLPIIGNLFFRQNILVYFLVIFVIFSTYFLYRTSWGLNLRAVGEYPQAVDTAGISVFKLRYFAVIACGCLASLGGAYLSLVQVRYFTEGMSAGKGFIAIAAIIFGRWHPLGVTLACILFAATEALQLRAQALGVNIPYQFLLMLPYLTALLGMIGMYGKSSPPAALGIPYSRNKRI